MLLKTTVHLIPLTVRYRLSKACVQGSNTRSCMWHLLLKFEALRVCSGSGLAFERAKGTLLGGAHQKALLPLPLCSPPQILKRWLEPACWGCSPFPLPPPGCADMGRAGRGDERRERWPPGFATCPGTRLVLGPGVGPAATPRCDFAACYLKPALSQEKRELLGMTVASGNPGEDRVEGKNHLRGPELGRAWRGTAAPTATGRLRPPPS